MFWIKLSSVLFIHSMHARVRVHVLIRVCVCFILFLQEHLQLVFHFWPNICVHTIKQSCINVKYFTFYQLWEAMCLTLKIQILHSKKYVAALKSGEEVAALIPSELTNRGWKYPLKSQEGGEDTPSKDTKLGALYNSLCEAFFPPHTQGL